MFYSGGPRISCLTANVAGNDYFHIMLRKCNIRLIKLQGKQAGVLYRTAKAKYLMNDEIIVT